MITKKQHFTITYGIYPYDLLVSIGESDEEVTDFIKDNIPEALHEEIHHVFVQGVSARTVFFPDGTTIIRFLDIDNGLIAHEALHAVHFLMHALGNKKITENWNYLIQYVVNQIHKKTGVI
jgi:hypothetical protein